MEYVGSKKHKRWTPRGGNGSICPDWTHQVDGRHFGRVEPEAWSDWSQTVAQRLLSQSVVHGRQRYAADRGVAFCAQQAKDGSWHGYPILWKQVPPDVCQQLRECGQVTATEIKRGLRRQQYIGPIQNRKWALSSDEQ